MVFTQYTDTMDFLRGELLKDTDFQVDVFLRTGRGNPLGRRFPGEGSTVTRPNGVFRAGEADILLCTGRRGRGLEFPVLWGARQLRHALETRCEWKQRIGRIDRLGQEYQVIRIVNLHYEGTVETDVYRASQTPYRSVSSPWSVACSRSWLSLPRRISETVLSGGSRDDGETGQYRGLHRATDAGKPRDGVFDIDAATEKRSRHAGTCTVRRWTMEDLDRVDPITGSDCHPALTSNRWGAANTGSSNRE